MLIGIGATQTLLFFLGIYNIYSAILAIAICFSAIVVAAVVIQVSSEINENT